MLCLKPCAQRAIAVRGGVVTRLMRSYVETEEGGRAFSCIAEFIPISLSQSNPVGRLAPALSVTFLPNVIPLDSFRNWKYARVMVVSPISCNKLQFAIEIELNCNVQILGEKQHAKHRKPKNEEGDNNKRRANFVCVCVYVCCFGECFFHNYLCDSPLPSGKHIFSFLFSSYHLGKDLRGNIRRHMRVLTSAPIGEMQQNETHPRHVTCIKSLTLRSLSGGGGRIPHQRAPAARAFRPRVTGRLRTTIVTYNLLNQTPHFVNAHHHHDQRLTLSHTWGERTLTRGRSDFCL